MIIFDSSATKFFISIIFLSRSCSHGVGIAGGCGYHKGSAAIETALHEMGIKLDRAIGGTGYDASVKVFESIMSVLGYTSFITAKFYP